MTEYADIKNPTVVSVTLEEFLTALNLGAINKIILGTDYQGVRQIHYMDMPINVNRYATHEDLKIPQEMLYSIAIDNIDPLLPP